MATKLGVYNRALAALSSRRLASLTEQREPRRVLDDLYADCEQFCIEQGMWNFGLISATLASAGAGSFGYSHFFTKPADFVHLFAASESASGDPPLVKDFVDQGASFHSNAASLYVRYLSNDGTAGAGNLTLWTASFTTFASLTLAAWAALRITGSQAMADAMERRAMRALLIALSIDSVPMLPGLLPFNAEARTLPVEGHAAQPIDQMPFHASLAAAAPAAPAAAGQG